MSRGSLPEEDSPWTPAQTSTTSVTSTLKTKASFRVWVPPEETDIAEDASLRKDSQTEADDGVPINRSDSFRNLSTLIAWEKMEGMHLQETEISLSRQNPQTSFDFSKCGPDSDAHGSPDSPVRFRESDHPHNKQSPSASGQSEEFELMENEGGTSKIPFRSRFMWRLRNFRNRRRKNPSGRATSQSA